MSDKHSEQRPNKSCEQDFRSVSPIVAYLQQDR
jgi:hypothetical protein